jgi:hypothetical protein
MGRATQGGTAQRNLKCVQLKSRVGICQGHPVQDAYLQRTALQLRLWEYSFAFGQGEEAVGERRKMGGRKGLPHH